MQKTFTKEFMHSNRGCYSEAQLNACSFMQKEEVTLDAILDSEISLKDKFWFVCKKPATQEQNQLIAIGVAEIVLPIFEERYPDDKRPREAIEAAKDYLDGKITIDKLYAKRRAAYTAAAYAADAAYAAATAYAAIAADAATAAYAAYAAYAAADVAYANPTYTSALLQFLKDFVSVN